MRRLFSTFAGGWPGLGLLFMRLVAGVALLAHGLTRLLTRLPIEPAILDVLAIAAGILLLAGLWTPIVGSLVAILGLWNSMSQSGDLSADIFLATIGAALAMLGPGAWSVDATLFGWKRIDVATTTAREVIGQARLHVREPSAKQRRRSDVVTGRRE